MAARRRRQGSVIHGVHGNAASGFSGGPQIRLPECRHRYNSRRHQRHQGSALSPLREQGSLGICHRRRDHGKTCPRQVVASYAQQRATHRHFDRHCPAVASSAPRHSKQLSAAQFGTGDVSSRRAIPQTTGEALPCLAEGVATLLRRGQSQGRCAAN